MPRCFIRRLLEARNTTLSLPVESVYGLMKKNLDKVFVVRPRLAFAAKGLSAAVSGMGGK